MTDHFPAATKKVGPASFLCASCGAEVRMDWVAPNFGLCELCEEQIMHGPVSYVPPVPAGSQEPKP